MSAQVGPGASPRVQLASEQSASVVCAYTTGECQGLAEELEEARKATAEAERERDEAAARGDELASQLADMTAARDALACASDPAFVNRTRPLMFDVSDGECMRENVGRDAELGTSQTLNARA